jgi:hypothetical protein
MMKKLLLIFIFILILEKAFSQYQKENLMISVETNQLNYENQLTKYGFGIEFQYYVNDYFGLNSHLIFGENYVHIPLGLVAIFAALLGGGNCNDCGDLNGCNSIFLLAILSDGVIFHIRIFGKPVLSPYLNLLGLDMIYDKDNGSKNYITGSVGIKFNYLLSKNINFSPFVELKRIYDQSTRGISFGISVGYLFK